MGEIGSSAPRTRAPWISIHGILLYEGRPKYREEADERVCTEVSEDCEYIFKALLKAERRICFFEMK